MAKPKRRGNGEGTVYYNGKYWTGQVTVGHDIETGKLKRKSIYSKTKREVNEKIIEMQNSVNKGTFSDPTNATVGEWANYWLENYKKHQVNDTTFETYEYQFKNHIIEPFGEIKLKNLTTFQIQEYLNKMKKNGMSSTYVKMIRTVLNGMLNQAVKLEAIAKNPCANIVLPKAGNKKEVKALTKEEQQKFIQYCYEKSEFLFIFMLGTGVRISEALGLTWDCVDFNNEIIKIKNIVVELKGKPKLQNYPKTDTSIRDVPMSVKVKEIMLKLYDNKITNEFNVVFPSHGNKLNYTLVIRQKLDKISTILDMEEINPHMLRHTFATRMLEAGANIKVLSEILGHKNIQITLDTYAHVMPDTKKENIEKIDDFL